MYRDFPLTSCGGLDLRDRHTCRDGAIVRLSRSFTP